MPKLPRIRLYVGISTVFVVLTVLIVGSVVWNTYRETRKTALDNAERLFDEVTTKVVERVAARLDSASAVVDVMASIPSISDEPVYDGLDHAAVDMMIEILASRPHSFSAFVGHGNGSFIQVTPSRGNPQILGAFEAPERTAYVIRTISTDIDGELKLYLRYLDARRRLIGATTKADFAYDPRTRPWYKLGLKSLRATLGDPYVFFSLQQPGFALSRRARRGGVIGLAITLEGFSEFLAEQRFADRSTVFIFDPEGRLLAHPNTDLSSLPANQADAGSTGGFVTIGSSRDPLVHAIGSAYLDQADAEKGIRSLVIDEEAQLYSVRPMRVGSGADVLVAASAPLRVFTAPFLRIQQRNAVFAVVVLAAAIPLIVFLARQISRKLAALELETERIRRFELEDPVDVDSPFREIHSLATAFGSMKASMYTFGRYVPKGLVQQILTSGGTAEAGGQRRELTLMFTDVEDFTTLSEAMDPAALMRHISAYFEAMGSGIARHVGVVDKYIGDAVMAFWNAPHLDPEHVPHACAAVLECRLVNDRFNAQATEQGLPPLRTRFGVHSGPVVVGNIGGAERMNYTAVGASVNIASRLEGLNRLYGTQILVSEVIRAGAGSGFLFRSIDRALPKGAVNPLEIFELMGAVPGNADVGRALWADDRVVALVAAWDRAYGAYTARDWFAARAAFEDVARQFPEDKPTALYAERCRRFLSEPPQASWDGVTRHAQK